MDFSRGANSDDRWGAKSEYRNHRSAGWRFLHKPKMCAIFVVPGNVLAEQAFQVAFVDGDDVI